MISKNEFERIMQKAKEYKYSSMDYIDFDDCKNAEVLHDKDNLILLCDNNKVSAMLYYATDDFEALIKIIADMQGKLRIHFVPNAYSEQLKNIGFTEWAEFIDYWNEDLKKAASLIDNKCDTEYLTKNECDEVVLLTKKCELQSRGFESVTSDYVLEWLNEGKVIIYRNASTIAGFCSVSIYNEGTTLWIRVIAVDPAYQASGIGKKLMEQATLYGVQNGATKGFLAADLLNNAAVALFNKFGFYAKDSSGELQMIRD